MLHNTSAALSGGGRLDAQAVVIAVTSALIVGDRRMALPANDADVASKREADAGAIETFVSVMFRHARARSYIHFRGFAEHNPDAKIAAATRGPGDRARHICRPMRAARHFLSARRDV
jgi:hypothetical protein